MLSKMITITGAKSNGPIEVGRIFFTKEYMGIVRESRNFGDKFFQAKIDKKERITSKKMAIFKSSKKI